MAQRDPDDNERMLLVNVVALTRLTRAALPGVDAWDRLQRAREAVAERASSDQPGQRCGIG